MKFNGEIKFPDVDHPGVPAQVVIEDSQIELVLEAESLGRWSLYDVHARRLVSNAFSIDLDGTEVTFVADDPIDFAYRGVEHMAESWAAIKAKQIATRTIAVRRSRRGTTPSRLPELRSAMQENLSVHEPRRRIAGEPSRALPGTEAAAEAAAETASLADVDFSKRFDADVPAAPTPPGASASPEGLAEIEAERMALEVERRRLGEEREALQRELREAEQREQDRITAFRIEMQRLEAERREMLARLEAAGESVADFEDPPDVSDVIPPAQAEAAEPAEQDEDAGGLAAETAMEQPPTEAGPEEFEESPIPVEADQLVSDDEAADDSGDEQVTEEVPEPEESGEEDEPDEPQVLAPVGGPSDDSDQDSVLDLSGIDSAPNGEVATEQLDSEQEQEPAMAGASRDSRAGLMGAVRAAFARGGGRTHEHQFVTAPGGLGITRWVCEECGYVSISVGED